MAVKDTHKAFERLTDAGYSKEMAEALLETLANLGIPWQPRRTLMPLEAI